MRIFVSSTREDLRAERDALRETIAQFDELFVGMEYFGSDPQKPAAYCAEQVRQSDLYVAIIGNRYGSVDPDTGKSFTELEYLEARSRGLDCLIYFRRSPDEAAEKLLEFKARLATHHVIREFPDVAELKVLFTTDFVKLLHGSLFYKVRISHPHAVPTETLRLFCEGALREQIDIVAHRKYVPDLYVRRACEDRIHDFTNFSRTYADLVTSILQKLDRVRISHLSSRLSAEQLQDLGTRLLNVASIRDAEPVLTALEEAFLFEESRDVLKSIDEVFRASEAALLKPRLAAVHAAFGRIPGIGKMAANRAVTRLDEAWRRAKSLQQQQAESYFMNEILNLLPSVYENARVVPAVSLLQDLRQHVDTMSRRCLAIVDQAGRGKTNVACHLAATLAKENPVFLMSGQAIGITEAGIEKHIQSILDRQLHSIFPDWRVRVSSGLESSQRWLFVIIDGINEAAEPGVLSHQLSEFLARIEHTRIKVILTCRDIFWELFRHRLKSFQFLPQPLALEDFTEAERDQAIPIYLKAYGIQAQISARARETLKHPLLLRLFCEAHRERDLGSVESIRSLSVFDNFTNLISQEIAHRLKLIALTPVRARLISIAHLIWQRRELLVPLTALGISEEEVHRADSMHSCLRNEAVITQVDNAVRFVHDEMCEYCLALSWCAIGDADRIARTAAAAVQSFPAAVGALLYFDELQDAKGSLVNIALSQLASAGDEVLVTRQYAMMQLLEAMAVASIDREVVAMLVRYEARVSDELKERLSKVIVAVARARPNDESARALLEKVLEVETPAVAPEKARSDSGSVLLDEEIRESLPPARYHYSVETRLCALSILISSEIDERHKLATEATDRLGRVELHSALRALEAIDYADDNAVFALIPAYLQERAPEYRIFSAQLLRTRFGDEPASFLITLLDDASTRVRDHVRELLRNRPVDPALAEALAHRLKTRRTPQDPALADLIAVIERRENFSTVAAGSDLSRRIVGELLSTLEDNSLIIRMESARALYAWRDCISPAQSASLRGVRWSGDVVVGGLLRKIGRALAATRSHGTTTSAPGAPAPPPR